MSPSPLPRPDRTGTGPCPKRPPREVILVDNASTDASVAAARGAYPGLRVVSNANNRGYAAAQNQALALADAPFHLALNPDVVLDPGYLEALLEGLAAHPEAGYAIGKIRVLQPDGTPTDRIYSTGHLFPRNRQGYNRGIGATDTGRHDRPELVPGANGSCPLYRREMILDLALDGRFWDELLFLYGDDLDVDWRAAMRGWGCLYWPTALAWHVGAGTGGLRRPDVRGMFAANRWLMVVKNDRPADFLPDLPFILKALLLEGAGMLAESPAALAHALRIFAAGLPAACRRRRQIARRRTRPLRPWFDLSLRLIRGEARPAPPRSPA